MGKKVVLYHMRIGMGVVSLCLWVPRIPFFCPICPVSEISLGRFGPLSFSPKGVIRENWPFFWEKSFFLAQFLGFFSQIFWELPPGEKKFILGEKRGLLSGEGLFLNRPPFGLFKPSGGPLLCWGGIFSRKHGFCPKYFA